MKCLGFSAETFLNYEHSKISREKIVMIIDAMAAFLAQGTRKTDHLLFGIKVSESHADKIVDVCTG